MDFGGNVTDFGLKLTMDYYSEGLISLLPAVVYQPWFCSLIGSVLIGLSGILPLLVIPIEEGANLKTGGSARTLNVLLSFAVGCLLGDVFLHLLPEVWSENDAHGVKGMHNGLWVLTGLLLFIILEKIFSVSTNTEANVELSDSCSNTNNTQNNNTAKETGTEKSTVNGYIDKTNLLQNGDLIKNCFNKRENGNAVDCNSAMNCQNGAARAAVNEETPKNSVLTSKSIHVSGYLNLMANSFDNFTHGLAVGGSFLISFPHGVLTTTAILLHEIPHEVGDFAILLRSGFSRWEAARAQILTATAGMMGSLTAVLLGGASGVETRTSWILPFTAGGFLHIALVTVLPDLLKEDKPMESLLQLASLLSGIGVMAAMASMTE